MNPSHLPPPNSGSVSGAPASPPALGHMELAGRFAEVMRTVVVSHIERHGDTPANRDWARETAYEYLARTFQRSKSVIRLYIRVYEKFSTNLDAVNMLNFRDIALLLGGEPTPEFIDKVVAARREHPELGTADIATLLATDRKQSNMPNTIRT
ncbi:hypothetical protein [Burkholderia vietnamiensis]|nr:hypothetical protein [Burkholderia vietnamiensis]MBR8085487.1 hypothetical protein [Burkholderia vietnamiensis]MDN7820160.1 hypothetical protein [Burkholderia vietnamiensis]HDR9172647.1 hypothetical protein [Burkholderia vietnamiensis]